MPAVPLKVTQLLPSDRDHHAPTAVRFRGNHGIDYLRGNCGSIMTAAMRPGQHVIVDGATCSGCGAKNEFPLDLRA